MKKKIRLDVFLSTGGHSRSREAAKREILSGWVRVDGETVREPSRLVMGDESVTVERPGGRFVSRGGEKLFKALKEFNIDLKGKNAADLGASTGGFTDCMLREGASIVYSVDVGYGQFDYNLRKDARVILMERTNVKDLCNEDFDHTIEFIAADLSFISILKVYPRIRDLFPGAEGIFLIKPQFEAERNENKKGVIKKIETHRIVVRRVLSALLEMGMTFRGLIYSPLKGPAGNIEFLLHVFISENSTGCEIPDTIVSIIDRTVEDAHKMLMGKHHEKY